MEVLTGQRRRDAGKEKWRRASSSGSIHTAYRQWEGAANNSAAEGEWRVGVASFDQGRQRQV